jgi:autotransporter-associated beta strand protein
MTWSATTINFIGSAPLNLAGTIALTADRTINPSSPGLNVANALTLSGVVSGANSLTKNGTGTLVLSAANTFGGAGKSLTLNAGVLAANHATNAVFGAASTSLIINGGALDALIASAPANNLAQTWAGDFAFIGTNTLNLGTGTVSLGTNAGTTRSLTLLGSTLTSGGVIANGTTVNSLTVNGATAYLSSFLLLLITAKGVRGFI